MKTPDLKISWCPISWTVQTNAFVDHGGFPLWASNYWLRGFPSLVAVRITVSRRPFTMTCIYLHPTACLFLFLLLPVRRTIVKCASWVLVLVAVLAASGWTNKHLHSCGVPMTDVCNVAPGNQLDLNPLSSCLGGCVSKICWCGIWEEDDNKKKWEVLRTIYLASCQDGISSSQDVPDTQDESYCVWPRVAKIFHRPAMCNM